MSTSEGPQVQPSRRALGRLRLRAQLKDLLARRPALYLLGRRVHNRLLFLAQQPHEQDFAAFAHFRDRQGLFLDVGANNGQSAMSFRLFHPTAPVLSVEANPFHEPDLRRLCRTLRPFDYVICAAGAAEGDAVLHVPMHRGLLLTGEASLHPVSGEDTWWLHQQQALLGRTGSAAPPSPDAGQMDVPVHVVRLDGLSLAPAFVKIDVEGGEADVLRGLRVTLDRCRPVLLLERSGDQDEISALLVGLEYSPWVYHRTSDRFTPYVGQTSQNLFYLQPGDERVVAP
jgi:FkbM family methyltransferase